jgi:ATP-binding protein involved in chromosome partitioning
MFINKIIGVMSCKGGVGKSTVAVNLAVSLANFYGKRVGLLDADIYGPNHPRLLGINDVFDIKFDSSKIFPIFKYNIFSMSFGYFLKINSSVLLRGPMVSNTIKYLFDNTKWGDLDILVVDFPPGTGDIYLSLLRDINFSGMILVTIPQILSIDDIRKSIFMLDKFKVDIICLIENMKFLSCFNCGFLNYLYDNEDIVNKLAVEFFISNIFKIPLLKEINESVVSGLPFVLNKVYKSDIVNLFKEISLLLL